MPKLPSLSSKQIITILQKHGFYLRRSSGSHFIFVNPTNKRKAIVPYHNKDLSKGTLISILRQAGIERDELLS